jgi:hypothetical protein
MTTASGRALVRCAAVSLLALLGGFLLTAMGALGADGAQDRSRTGSIIPSPAPPARPL